MTDETLFLFELYKDGLSITGYDGDADTFDIPETIDQLPVRKLAEEAFVYSDLKSVSLPSTLKEIGPNVFSFCFDLNELALPEGLESLDGSSLLCTGIKQLRLPAGLKEITSPESLDMHLFTEPGSERYFADGTGLYEKSPAGEMTLLSTFTDTATEYSICDYTTELAPTAFQNVHSELSLHFPKQLSKIAGRALHPFFTHGESRLTGLSISPENQTFHINADGLWMRAPEGDILIRWTGPYDALLPENVRRLQPYSMAEMDFTSVRLSPSCYVEKGAFTGSTVRMLDVNGPVLMPEGTVENNALLAKIFASGTADFSEYTNMLLTSYLTPERLRMSLLWLSHSCQSASAKDELLTRLLHNGTSAASFALEESSPDLFSGWLSMPGHTAETLSPAMETLSSYHGLHQTEAREMLAALLRKKSSLVEEDPFAL